jgi:hypothetical protein
MFKELMNKGDDKYCKVMAFGINKFLKAFKSWPVSGKQRDREDNSDDETPARASTSKRARLSSGADLNGAYSMDTLEIPDDDALLSEDL